MATIQPLLKPNHPIIKIGHPLASGIVFDEPFFEGAGFYEQQTNIFNPNLNSIFNGSPTWQQSVFGSTINLRGQSNADYIKISLSKILAGLKNWSIVSLINFNVAPVNGTTQAWSIYVERASTGNDILGLEVSNGNNSDTAGNLRMVYRDDANTLNRFSTSFAMSINNWYLVVATKSGTALNLYINSIPPTAATFTTSDTLTNAIESRIGGDAQNTAAYFPGLIALTRLYNRPITSTEVLQTYVNPWQIYVRPNFIPYLNSNPVAGGVQYYSFLPVLGIG